jgi:hypothetical protein
MSYKKGYFHTSWTAVKKFFKCPLSYKFKYVDKKKPKFIKCKYHAIVGITIQKVFEYFYNLKWYRKRKQTLPFIFSRLDQIYEEVLEKNYVDWEKAPSSKEEVLEEIKEIIPKALKIIKENRLLGQYNRSEKFSIIFLKTNAIKGYIDFVIKKEDDLIVLDGKDVKNEDAVHNLEKEQLFLYGIMLAHQNKIVPTKMGFLLWRLDRIEWIDFSKDDLRTFRSEFLNQIWKIRNAIKSNKFPVTPSKSVCSFCEYEKECNFAYKDPIINKDEDGYLSI